MQTFELDLLRTPDLQEIGNARLHGRANQDLSANRVGLNAVRLVNRAAHRPVLRALLRADIAHDDLAGIDANAHPQFRQTTAALFRIDLHQRSLHLNGACDSALLIIVGRNRGSKERQNTIALKFVDRASMGH